MFSFLSIVSAAMLVSSGNVPPEWQQAADLLHSSMNESANACEDFYNYACGNWAKHHAVPGQSVNTATLQTVMVYKKLAEILRKVDPIIPAVKELKTFFEICVKGTTSEKDDLQYLLKLFDNYGRWPMLYQQWKAPVGTLAVPTFLTVHVDANYKHPTKHVLLVIPPSNTEQAIVTENSTLSEVRNVVTTAVTNLAKAANISLDALKLETDARDIASLELKLYKLLAPVLKKEHFPGFPNKFYSIKAAEKRWPFLDWQSLITRVAEDNFKIDHNVKNEINVAYPEILDKFKGIFKGLSERQMQNFLLWRLVGKQLPFMDSKFEDPLLKEVKKNKMLTITPELICAVKAEEYLPLATGRVYLDFYRAQMPSNTYASATDMVAFVIAAFRGMLYDAKRLLDSSSRSAAYEKLDYLVRVVGNDHYVTNDTFLKQAYSKLQLTEHDDTFLTMNKLTRFNTYSLLHKLHTTVDRSRMHHSTVAVNAAYAAFLNHIEITAAILNQTVFYPGRPLAVNYGMLGAVLGHEVTHGFDTWGVKWDAKGMYTEKGWLSEESKKHFDKMAKCVVDQYDKFCYPQFNNSCVNGTMTVGENIADAGGLMASYRAYQNVLDVSGKEPRLPEPMAKYSMEKVFFISFANFYCNNMTRDVILSRLKTDPHSPDTFRVIGTPRNIPEFGKVFDCKIGDPMYPKKHCHVWTD